MIVQCIFFLCLAVFSCAHEHIDQFFAQYRRPITVFDLHVMPCGEYAQMCPHGSAFVTFISKHNKVQFLDDWIYFNTPWSVEKLKKIAECEYVDVVLIAATDVKDENFVDVCSLSDYVCVTCNEENEQEQLMLLTNKYGKENCLYMNDNKYIVCIKTNHSSFLVRRNICWHLPTSKIYKVESTFESKQLFKQDIQTGRTFVSDWLPGINFLTYIFFGIIWPNKEQLMPELLKIKEIIHPDWGPANMILSGAKLTMIDLEDIHYAPLNKTDVLVIKKFINRRFAKMLTMIGLNGKEITHYYWYVYHTPVTRFFAEG